MRTEEGKKIDKTGGYSCHIPGFLGTVNCNSYTWIKHNTWETFFHVIGFVDKASLVTAALQMSLHSWQTENNNIQTLPGCWFWFFIRGKVVAVHFPWKASTARQMQINEERIQTVQINDRAGAVWAQSFPDGGKINRFLQQIQMIFSFYTTCALCWKIRLLPIGENSFFFFLKHIYI